ncbi:MAG: tRNA (adenosine(37)-N6)-threonylcarbamoyltransferase complex dimerization subunit type 1 TsaB [Synechococcales cyanobacterium]
MDSLWFLGISTVTASLGLAWGDPNAERSPHSLTWPWGRQMASQLHICLQNVMSEGLTWDHCAGVAVAVGPGSFTGSRLGVTVARTLGQTLGIPVYGFSALAALAHSSGLDPVAVRLDAKRGEWIGGVYERQGSQILAQIPEHLWSEAQWQDLVTSLGIPALTLSDDSAADVLAASLVMLGREALTEGRESPWWQVVPNYSRQPPIG